MKQSDILIGGEYAFVGVRGLSKIRVIEKGLRRHPYSGRADAVQAVLVAGAHYDGLLATRRMSPWTERHDALLERQAERVAQDERIARVAARLKVPANTGFGGVVISRDSFFELAQRLGVKTD